MNLWYKLAASLLILLLSQAVYSQQIVHVESKTLAARDEGFNGNLALQANFIQNINDIFQTSNLAHMSYTKGQNSFISVTNHNLTVLNGNNIVNDGYQHFRYIRKVNKTIAFEAFSQGQFNEIIKIKFRGLNGMGPRFSVINNDSTETQLFIGTHYMYEYEEETYEGIINRHHRLNLFTSFGFEIGKLATVSIIGYYQPDLLHWNDFRTSIEATIDFRLTGKLSFRFQHSLFYDSNPPDEIRNTFYNFRNGLRYSF